MLKASLEVWVAKWGATQGYAAQLHLIAGEGSSLVAEDIFHHAKILHHVCVAGFGKVTRGLMLHLSIQVNVLSLQQKSQLLSMIDGQADPKA